MKHELTLQQQIDNARELLTAQGFNVTAPEPKKEEARAWEPKENEVVLALGGDGNINSHHYAPYLHLYRQRGRVFLDTPEGRAQAEAKDKRALLIAEAEREGMPKEGEGYWCAKNGGTAQHLWDLWAYDFAFFRSGNFSRTRGGMEDKVRRFGLDVVVGRK